MLPIVPYLTMDIAIPSIFVEALPESPFDSTKDIASVGIMTPPLSSPIPGDFRFNTADVSFSPDGSRLQRSSRRNSDFSMFAMDIPFRSP